MSPRLDVGQYSSGAGASEDITELLDAAEELERQLGAEPGIVLRQLSAMVRRQVIFQGLHEEYGIRRDTCRIPGRAPGNPGDLS
jgi:hypothetical protein